MVDIFDKHFAWYKLRVYTINIEKAFGKNESDEYIIYTVRGKCIISWQDELNGWIICCKDADVSYYVEDLIVKRGITHGQRFRNIR